MNEIVEEVCVSINQMVCLEEEDWAANHEMLVKNLGALRNLCAHGPNVQMLIARHPCLTQFIRNLLFRKVYSDEELMKEVQTIAWQMLANVIVNNDETQDIVWQKYSGDIAQQCFDRERPLDRNVDISLMIVYNTMKSKGESAALEFPSILRAVVCLWRKVWQWKILRLESTLQINYLHLIFEEFVVKNGRDGVRCYVELQPMEKIVFLDYILDYIRSDNPNGPIHTFLLQHIAKEFKLKSYCVLKVSSLKEVDLMKPREAFALLQFIASASGSEQYGETYATDHSLFLNVSSLLENNIFTPMSKLVEVAPTSYANREYEKFFSYMLKKSLVRCVANLLYNNPTNQGHCLDTQLMPALFECTKLDATDPYEFQNAKAIKEWTILAIRNACIGRPELQQVIANLTSEGPAQNDVLSELNLDMGSLRINP